MILRPGPPPLRAFLLAIAVALSGACASTAPSQPASPLADPLSAWADSAPKRAILDYLDRITQPGGPDTIPPEHRVATFDFDGTIGCEKPDYMEVMVAIHRLCELTKTKPALLDEALYRAACDGDLETINASVDQALLQAFLGETQSFYVDYVERFLRTQHHPRFERPYAELYYLPMLQLIRLLQAHDFTVYVVSGSQQGFARAFATRVLGLPPSQVVGNTVSLDYSLSDGTSSLTRQDAFLPPNPGGAGKAEIIRNRLGQQPVFAFGNSMGDLEMLQYATSGKHPSLGLILVHDDPREYVYSDAELLQKAEDLGFEKVSMKADFDGLFPE